LFVYGITSDVSSLVDELREIATVSSDSIESEEPDTVYSELDVDEEGDEDPSNPFISE